MSRVLIVIDSPLFSEAGRMAGLQIRTYEMARALQRRGHEVTIATPLPQEIHSPFIRCIAINEIAGSPRFAAWIASPLVAAKHFTRLGEVPFIMDGYEAPFASFLAQGAALLPTLGARVMHEYRKTISGFLRAIERADLVLCATEGQRVCYLTLLSALGRINPKYPDEDLVSIVQSGAPPEPPRQCAPAAGEAGPVVLWAGGYYPWFDPETFVAAMPKIVAAVPEVGFVFAGLGGRDQIQDLPKGFPAAHRVFEQVNCSPDLGTRSRFVAWQPYAERDALYAGATVGVCTYKRQIETVFSMRTRIIDMVWGGLPIVATGGDSLSATVEERGAGAVVGAESPKALADAVVGILKNPHKRAQMAAAARALAEGNWNWDSLIEPLHRFCLAPHRAPDRDDPLIARTTGDMIRIGDGVDWRLRDLGWRVWWRFARLFSSSPSEKHRDVSPQEVVPRR